MGLVQGKRALVLGIANERSLAYAIAQKLSSEGASLALTYQGEALEERVRNLAEPLGARIIQIGHISREISEIVFLTGFVKGPAPCFLTVFTAVLGSPIVIWQLSAPDIPVVVRCNPLC